MTQADHYTYAAPVNADVTGKPVPQPVELRIRVVGKPARQGSKSFKGMRGGRPLMVEADPNLPRWRRQVQEAAKTASRARAWRCLDGPVAVEITFLLPRPPSVCRKWPARKGDGDVDKLVRAVLDALTLAHVWEDDSRVCEVHARKAYARPPQPPGALIIITPLEDT